MDKVEKIYQQAKNFAKETGISDAADHMGDGVRLAMNDLDEGRRRTVKKVKHKMIERLEDF